MENMWNISNYTQKFTVFLFLSFAVSVSSSLEWMAMPSATEINIFEEEEKKSNYNWFSRHFSCKNERYRILYDNKYWAICFVHIPSIYHSHHQKQHHGQSHNHNNQIYVQLGIRRVHFEFGFGWKFGFFQFFVIFFLLEVRLWNYPFEHRQFIDPVNTLNQLLCFIDMCQMICVRLARHKISINKAHHIYCHSVAVYLPMQFS